MLKKLKKSNIKGSFTLEVAIVFPLVLIIVAGIIYFTYLLYLKATIQSMADVSVRRGIKVWDNINKDLSTGRNPKINSDLYWNIFDVNKDQKEDKLNTWLSSNFKSNILLYKPDIDVNVCMSNYLLYKQLNSEIIVYCKTPIDTGEKEYIQVKGNSKAILNHPPDFIRNTDFIVDLEMELEHKYKSFEEFMNRIRKIMDEITLNIERFGAYEDQVFREAFKN